MAEENGREGMLRSLERIRANANKLENELVELHNVVRFDHQSQGAKERVRTLEVQLGQLATALRVFRENFEEREPGK